VTLTGCVHQLHIEVLEAEAEEHSVESIVAAVGRTAQQAAKFFAKLTSPGPGGGAAK
jgi:imidazoleglycerol phosphate dehydratase HisB